MGKRVAASVAVTLLVVCGMLAAGTAGVNAQGPRILLYPASGGEDTIVETLLVGTGLIDAGEIDGLTMTDPPPSLAVLDDYDCVVAWTNSSPPNPVAQGDILADFVDDGGVAVLMVYGLSSPDDPWEIQGRIMGDGYNPLDLTTTALTVFPRSLDMSTALTSHPVLDGVSGFDYDGNTNYVEVTLDPGATLIGDDDQGVPLIAVNDDGNVYGFNLWPANPANTDEDIFQVIYNACASAEPEPTPTPTPTSTPLPLPTARPQIGGAAAGIVSAITTGVQNSQQVFGADPTAVGIAPPSTGTGVITPPSTGDAGLEESGNASVLLVGGSVLAGLVILATARRLARRGL
jgi:hypothetical protein